MKLPDIVADPSPTTLRQFSAICLAFFPALAAANAAAGGRPALTAVLAAAGVGVGVTGVVRPALVRPVFVGWTLAVYPIGWVVSRGTLAVCYYLVLTPVALVFKIIGRDALRRRMDPSAETYWRPKPARKDAADYLRQF